jgi:glycosyltransferase involved in cell wall biosynthesis/GT2 family glycosyltransferase
MDTSKSDFSGLRVGILTAGAAHAAKGGAERFYEGLAKGFLAIGCLADLIEVPADESTFENVLGNFDKCRQLDLSGYDLVISTKVPTYAVRHPNHVLYLVHTVRVFDDMFYENFNPLLREHFQQRARLHRVDFDALQGARARFAIGHEVAQRLYRWRGLDCDVLHPPLGFSGFRKGSVGDYFFLPGRLHPWKRVDLIIEAVRRSTLPLKFLIAGTGEAESELKLLAGGDERIQFLGRISDEELVDLYANSLAVPFVPVREDYGYVTLEAFSSGKAVITCVDSGEPAYFVRNFENGLIVDPDPESICHALECLYANREKTFQMGEMGARLVEGMSWEATAATLARAGMAQESLARVTKSRVTVLDMQPIDPPVGGGRQRLLGLYHNLGKTTECRYVGTFDWPGERYRAHALSETLFEINVPLSDAHHGKATELSRQVGGKVVIDLAFSQQAVLSPEYLETARAELIAADVVVFSHPWVFPLVKDCLRPDQVVVYDSQNVEGFLRAQLLNEENPAEAALIRQVAQDEYDVGMRADWILACSLDDLLRFNRVYEFCPGKMRVVPNGVMAFNGQIPTADALRIARGRLRIPAEAFVAIFIGSGYGPNVEAAAFIDHVLSAAMPDVSFVVAGGVGVGMRPSCKNVVATGQLDDADKYLWFQAADIAINPMMSGSGTNIKMFDFMAMGLPVVSTAVGARGIETAGREVMLIAEPNVESFAAAIEQLMDLSVRQKLAEEARACVEDSYSWERISEQLGVFLMARKRRAAQPPPLFSVVVPTYERHDQLGDLMERLRNQIERDFEVVLVDQSVTRWGEAEKNFGFPLVYFHCPVKGAVRARNTGAMLAQGSILAFVDDDCLPAEGWLLNSRRYFDDSDVVGVEGLIESDHYENPAWRPVTNLGFEGIGFMTANLLVRSPVFQYLGGFDLQFDRPHFREDTDFGWRMQAVGEVPYANDVVVFHPAQPRSKERESSTERAIFFQKDALLYQKHPDRYRALFMAEGHYQRTHGFVENLKRGFDDIHLPMPEWMKSCVEDS